MRSNLSFSDNVEFLDEARDEYDRLDGSVKIQVIKAINKISENPVVSTEGGLGKPLGNKGTTDLTGLGKIKLKKTGSRIVYKPVKKGNTGMVVIIIAARADNEVYLEAQRRIEKLERTKYY